MSQVTTHDLWVDGRSMQLTAVKPDATSLQLTWTIPSNPRAYDGAVILVSETPFSANEYPVDGTRYTASSNWTSPGDSIGNARVVAAIYGFFGDDTTQTTVTVTNLEADRVYYASIHAASNVLQYFTIGVQSYPLEANDPTKKNSAFAGAIPQAAPQNPTDGMVYYDAASNSVLMWSDDQDTWIKANQLPVSVGTSPKIDVGSLFHIAGSDTLHFFDGTQWVVADETNVRVKMGAAWAPFNGIAGVGDYPASPTSGDFVFITVPAQLSAPPTKYIKLYSLGQWFNPTPGMVQVLIGADWTPIKAPSYDSAFGPRLPDIPSIGDFFYNTATKDLMVWASDGWVKADTADEGTPLPDRTFVGTDGTNTARLGLIKRVKTQMGWPSVCVELKDENFDLAVENALAELRRRADNAYEHRYISFTLIGGPNGGQNTYYLNDPRDKTDRIVNVLKIHRINQLGISSLSAESGLYAQAFYNQLYQGSNVDVLSIHLMNQLSELYTRIFAGDIMFTWNEARRELVIHRRLLQAQERVVLEVMMERPEQELIEDRWTKMWIQNWAFADATEQLGLIRSKYGTLPSANGSLTLNGDALLAMAAERKTELLRQINDFEVGNGGVDFGNTAVLIG